MLQILGYLVLGGVGVFVVLWLLNKRAGYNILHFARTKAGQVGDTFSGMDPAGQMKQAAEDALKDLGNTDKALIASETLRNRLKNQVDSETRQVNLLRKQIADKLTKGTPETDPWITESARRVVDLERAIQENQQQYNQQGEIYAGLLKNANSAAARIRSAMQRAEHKRVQLEVSQGNVKMAEMVAEYDPSRITGKLNNIDKYEQEADNQIIVNNSKLKVMNDRGLTSNGDEELAVSEDVSNVLADIKAKTGNPDMTSVSMVK